MAETLEILINAKDNASGILGGIKGHLSTIFDTAMGFIARDVFTGVINGVRDLGRTMYEEATEAQRVESQLAAVLESTGGVAGVTAEMASNLADSLSRVTMFSDDAIMSGESMLLTFTNIGKDVFPQATETILNMSQAMGQDLQSSAIQLGKALNDPIAGVGALARVGVQFTDAQKDAIKAMVESGDVAGAQKVILQELQKEFGNSAQAAGQTFTGQLTILQNQFKNVAEEVGKELLPLLTDGLKSVGPILIDLTRQAVEFVKSDEFKAWLKSVGDFLKNDLPPIVRDISDIWNNVFKPAIQAVIDVINALKPAADGTFTEIRRIFDGFRALFNGDFEAWGAFLKENWIRTWGAIVQAVQNINWPQLGRDIITGIVNGLRMAGQAIVDFLMWNIRASWDTIRGFFGLPPSSGGTNSTNNTTNNYNLNINTNAPVEPIVQDFNMLQSMAGGQ